MIFISYMHYNDDTTRIGGSIKIERQIPLNIPWRIAIYFSTKVKNSKEQSVRRNKKNQVY